MKKVEIITPNGRLTDIHNALNDIGVGGMSHYGIEGAGKIKADPVVAATHPAQTPPEYIMRHKVEVVVKDEQVERLISAIKGKLSNEQQGGKIFVTDVPIAVDIATGKTGDNAI
jgi:nitrogen regulatory protein P-II 1